MSQTKKSLEKSEKDFIKYKDDSEKRIEALKTEIGILQRHYDQLQSSLHESEMDRSFSSAEKSAEIIKLIEEYSKGNEAKSKEIEFLTQKLDKKYTKIAELKKNKLENETKNTKLKSTLENVKTFLKFMNTNFLKSMKQENLKLR